MSTIYIKEPPTSGKVLLETSVGDIDIELWCKECPVACRNFIQLCMEGYFDKSTFHRLVPGFLIQGGDPTGTGDGGESVYGKPFKDEFHQRLKFERRGLLGMASEEPNSNTSQFFFTLGPAPELTGKNTMFGKVTGNTLYNMLALGDTGVDEEGRPVKKHVIHKTEVLNNPFDEIEPRLKVKTPVELVSEKEKAKQNKVKAVKNFNLLSFGDEAEEDEEENDQVVANQFKGRSKSAHDLINDSKLSKEVAVDVNELKRGPDDNNQKISENKVGSKKQKFEKESSSESDSDKDNCNTESGNINKLADLKAQSDKLKSDLKRQKSQKKAEMEKAKQKQKEDEKDADDIYSLSYVKKYRHLKRLTAKTQSEKAAKQNMTMKMLADFEAKLTAANTLNLASNYDDEDEEDVVDGGNSSASWITHKFKPEDDLKQARDANIDRGEDDYEIFDPRNPMNKRRRENAKKSMKNQRKPLAGVKELD